MDVYLVDGTYELFRHFYALPSRIAADGREVAATRGVLGSVMGMIESGVTHLAVATDHVIESFRNDLWSGYKTGEGIDPALREQFLLLEESLMAMGVLVWPMVEFEADDALADAAALAQSLAAVDRVYICSPDKDLAQCVRADQVVQLDRRNRTTTDEAGVVAKFGVPPSSIPDYLALVGDSADGIPGIPSWGARSTALVLSRWERIESIPDDHSEWDVEVRGAARLSRNLEEARESAYLYRQLATLRTDIGVFDSIDALKWRGPGPGFAAVARSLEFSDLADRAAACAERLPAQGPPATPTR